MLFVWTYLNNWLAVRWPLTAITSCIFMPLSNILEIASWRRSWKVRSVIVARFLSLCQAWRKATSVKGKGRSSNLDAALKFETASSLNGTYLDEPFFVMGRNAVFWSKSICVQRNPSILPRLIAVSMAKITIGQRYHDHVSDPARLDVQAVDIFLKWLKASENCPMKFVEIGNQLGITYLVKS